ncbi:MAG: hypothetical protein PHV74_07010 [Dehalococcoidia bacterium]|nr:hypothetical protein [Dehalococcoidia bacterium]
MDELTDVLSGLAEKRPLFHSEADFQHALAWQLRTQGDVTDVRLELPVDQHGNSLHLDILAINGSHRLAIELKYKTRKLTSMVRNETFSLRDQAAQDIARYDFAKDIWRLEQVLANHSDMVGYAILLTNDSAYWERSNRSTVDEQFRLHEGRTLQGTLEWESGASDGTKSKRESPIPLSGAYGMRWRVYSNLIQEPYGQFRYLMVKVGNTECSADRH